MSIESLYPLVTEAIRRAEWLDDLQDPGAQAAYLEVSRLEERIAEALPAAEPEGALARRGAVRAALAAGELNRAQELADRFLREDITNTELRAELLQLLATLKGEAQTQTSGNNQVGDLGWRS